MESCTLDATGGTTGVLRRILVLSEELRAGVQPKALLRSENSDIDIFQPAEYSPLPVALGESQVKAGIQPSLQRRRNIL